MCHSCVSDPPVELHAPRLNPHSSRRRDDLRLLPAPYSPPRPAAHSERHYQRLTGRPGPSSRILRPRLRNRITSPHHTPRSFSPTRAHLSELTPSSSPPVINPSVITPRFHLPGFVPRPHPPVSRPFSTLAYACLLSIPRDYPLFSLRSFPAFCPPFAPHLAFAPAVPTFTLFSFSLPTSHLFVISLPSSYSRLPALSHARYHFLSRVPHRRSRMPPSAHIGSARERAEDRSRHPEPRTMTIRLC